MRAICILITATLPKFLDRTTLTKLIDKYELYFEPIQNKYLEEQIEDNDIYLKATKLGCDCETGLGSYGIFNKRPSIEQLKSMGEKERKQFEDWVKERNYELESDVEKWLKFITELLELKYVTRLGLLIHFYRGQNESEEKFVIKHVEKINVKNLNVELLMKMEEDILYQFTSR